jgi:Leucine-rich repeat (LRR) protein
VEYFWYHRPEDDHPPPIVRRPEELGSADRAAVGCTQTDLPSAQQRALVREWCDLLPALSGVRLLWLTSRVPQRLFDAACAMPDLEGLYVKWSGIQNLDALAEARGLRHFHLGSSASLESIDALAARTNLETLGLENVKRISDLGPLGELRGLQQLAVEGSMWTTQHVETLEPIGRLSELRYLSLVNLRARDGTLRPLLALRKLRRFHAATWWDEAERQELRSLNPDMVDG